MNDLERARAHLKQAEGARDGTDAALDAAVAGAYATIALADRLGVVLEHLMKPIRMTTPTHPVVEHDRAWYEERMNEAVRRRDPEEIRRATDALNRIRVVERMADANPIASTERARDLDGAEAPAPTGGVFGQMEDRPNDLDDLEKH